MPDIGLAGAAACAAADRISPCPPAVGRDHLVVACTLRSGSNLLCEILRANGFGEPKEWFQAPAGLAPGTTTTSASDTSRLANQIGCFETAHASARWRATKFDWPQFQRFQALSASTPAGTAFLRTLRHGSWIFLGRHDLASQAVSLYAAQLTGAWLGEDCVDYNALPWDFDAIHERFAAIAADRFAWEMYFRASGIVPIRCQHEDLVGGGGEAWLTLLRALDPAFDPARLDLDALRRRPPEHPRLRALKQWFQDEMLSGRRPRSMLAMLGEIGATVARLERAPSLDGVLGRLVGDIIANPDGFTLRKLDLRRDLRLEGPATFVERNHFLDRVALRLDPGARASFAVHGTRFMVQFHAHGWSGIAEIRFDDVSEQLDLFSERADTRHFVRDTSPGTPPWYRSRARTPSTCCPMAWRSGCSGFSCCARAANNGVPGQDGP